MTDVGDLTGNVAIVTGAARGQGAEFARVLCERGASVLLTDVREAEGEGTAAGLGERAVVHPPRRRRRRRLDRGRSPLPRSASASSPHSSTTPASTGPGPCRRPTTITGTRISRSTRPGRSTACAPRPRRSSGPGGGAIVNICSGVCPVRLAPLLRLLGEQVGAARDEPLGGEGARSPRDPRQRDLPRPGGDGDGHRNGPRPRRGDAGEDPARPDRKPRATSPTPSLS